MYAKTHAFLVLVFSSDNNPTGIRLSSCILYNWIYFKKEVHTDSGYASGSVLNASDVCIGRCVHTCAVGILVSARSQS